MLKTNSLELRANSRLLIAAVLVLLMARPATADTPVLGGLEGSWAETDTRADGTTFQRACLSRPTRQTRALMAPPFLCC